MSHVDDGALHAYLDGALDEYGAEEAARVRGHLDACADCSARLAEEARVREEAGAVLAGAVPEVELPPFEELRALAGARGHARRGLDRLQRLGWAASVVLALGTGWLLRGFEPPTPGARPTGAEAPTTPTSTPTVQAPADETPAGAEAPDGSDPAADVEEDLENRAPGAPATAEEVVSRAEAVAPTEALEVAGAGAGAAEPQRTERADTPGVARTGAGAVSEPSVADVVVAPLSRQRAAAERARIDAAAAEPAAAPSPSTSRDEAGAREEAVPIAVPGLEVLSVASLRGGAPEGTVRVTQRLESGDTLEILRLPPGADPSELAPPPADGRTELFVPTDGGFLVLRAALDGEELRRLAAALLGRGF